MNTTKALPLYFFLALCLFAACEEEEECQEESLEVIALDDLSDCYTDMTRSDLLSSGAVGQITTEAEYNTLTQADCRPSIDFENFDLVIGTHITSNQVADDGVTYFYDRLCTSDNEQNLVIAIAQTDVATQDTTYFQALVPKVESDELLTVTIRLSRN